MSLMRYITPTLDEMFMDSLQWVDQTYIQKHRADDPATLRAMYYPNLRQYSTHGDTSKQRAPRDAAFAFLARFGRRAGISLAIYLLSYLPVVGRFVLPAASFWTFNRAVGPVPATAIFGAGVLVPRRWVVVFLQSYFSSRSLMRELLEPYFSRIRFTKEQKRRWFRDREGLLFGFGVGFYIFLRIPLLGVLIYGIAEASTAYLITKITDPPPPPSESESEKFAESQVRWKNKHEFLRLPLDHLDVPNVPRTQADDKPIQPQELRGKKTDGTPMVRTSNSQLPSNHSNTPPPPLVPFAGTIKNGEIVKIECLDWTGGQIGNNDSADDMKSVDLTRVHYLSGPFEVETAEPGDVLIVEIQDVQPFQEQPWGFTGVFDKRNGGGFLDEIYPEAAKAIWDLEGIFCSSRHIPHVRFAGLIHPGILGCAPSPSILALWNKREGDLIAANTLDRIVAQPPEPQNVYAGLAAPSSLLEKIGREGARTIPGRPEHGGNCDIKNLSRGSKVYLPVHVEGAKFSVGDLHFSQGDGEISFCGAIEIAGVITVKLSVMKDGMRDLGMKSPLFLPGPVEPQFGPGRYLTFEGFSVDEKGRQHYLDATVAYRQTTLRCIEYLKRFGEFLSLAPGFGWVEGPVCVGGGVGVGFVDWKGANAEIGYDDYQIYLLLSCAPIQGHIAGLVDIPNACTTLGLPMDIFDFDIAPNGPVEKMDMGSCAK
ncbi:hypothetical protein MMC30_003784 [Trapelia coarctata]|nr:hypothetical protein [Trapelia coarctata]